MGYNNPPVKWSELERRLSNRSRPGSDGGRPAAGDGGDSPAWSQHRGPYVAADQGESPIDRAARLRADAVPYAELHCALDILVPRRRFAAGEAGGDRGRSRPARSGVDRSRRLLWRGAVRRGRDGAWCADGVRCGVVAGVVGSAERCRGPRRLPSAGLGRGCRRATTGWPARSPKRSSRAARRAGPCMTWRSWPPAAAITGSSLPAAAKAPCGRPWRTGERPPVRPPPTGELDRLVALFGADRVVVELTDHHLPTDSTRNRILADLAASRGLPVVATNNVHYAHPRDHQLAAALAAVRARRDLDAMDGWLPPAGMAFLRSGAGDGGNSSAATPARWSTRCGWPSSSGSICAAPSPSCRCAMCRRGRRR